MGRRRPASEPLVCPIGALPVVPNRGPARPTGRFGPSSNGMVIGMATKKITVTLDEAQVEQVRALVEAGTASSVSGFVQHAVGVSLDDVAGWGALLAEALRETGGALSNEERDWSDDILGVTKPDKISAA